MSRAPRVRVLDGTVANQIAAGEVVERPASVAKELLENALDAGGRAITLEVCEGGVGRIRVTDDGHGMSREDAVLALERHATSKLRCAEDLQRLSTLGFRGEALPSIASVSRFQLCTRTEGALGATLLKVEGGGPPEICDAGGPVGTSVLVEDLFFNLPARRKFLKRPATETAHVQEMVQQLAIAWPEVAFKLIKEGRDAIDVPRHETLLDRLRALFGGAVADRLQPVVAHPGAGFSFDGYLGAPADARGTARHYHLFVNGRFVRDRVIMGAVRAAYRPHLEPRRHPFVVLRLRLPPELVDVNVHPSKTEVRFVDNGVVHRRLVAAIGEVLRRDPWADPAPATGRPYTLDVQDPPPAPAPATESASPATEGAPPAGESAGDEHRRRVFDVLARLGAQRRALGLRANPDARAPAPKLPLFGGAPVPASTPGTQPIELGPNPPIGSIPFDRLAVLGFRGGLLFCAAADHLVWVEVQAARAAIAFDAMLAAGAAGRPLDPPRKIELGGVSADRLARLEAAAGAWARIGLEVEPFGGRAVRLRALPAALDLDRAAALIEALLGLPEGASAEALAAAAVAYLGPLEIAASDLEGWRGLLDALAAVQRWPSPARPLCQVQSFVALRRALRAPGE